MELEIQSQRNNTLLNRTEVRFVIIHTGEATPRRELVRTELAEKLHTKKDNVIIDHMNSEFGVYKTSGYAKVYSSVEKAKSNEKEYLIKRNQIAGGKGKEEKEKPQKEPATEKTEKPSEQEPEKPVEQEKPVGEQETSSGKQSDKQPNDEKKGDA